MQDKKLYLDNLHYQKEFDNQQGNLEICSAYKDKEGTPKFSKWKKYREKKLFGLDAPATIFLGR